MATLQLQPTAATPDPPPPAATLPVGGEGWLLAMVLKILRESCGEGTSYFFIEKGANLLLVWNFFIYSVWDFPIAVELVT